MAKIYYNDNGTWKVVNIPGGGGGSIDADTLNGLLSAGDGISIGKTTAGDKVEVKIDPKANLKGKSLTAEDVSGSVTQSTKLNYDGYIIITNSAGIKTFSIPWNFGSGSLLTDKYVKTLFGNQSIVGRGNIDLYNHDIKITGTDANIDGVYEVHVFKTSSNNLKVDSLTDLKTLLGNTFKYWNVNGWLQNNLDSKSEIAIYVTESSVAFQSPTSSEYTISLAGATFTDDVTTV